MPRAKTKMHKERNALMNKSRNTFRKEKQKQNCVLKAQYAGMGGLCGEHPPLDTSDSVTVTLNLPRSTTSDTHNVRSHTCT